MSRLKRPSRSRPSSANDELNSFGDYNITFTQDDSIQASPMPPMSKGEILRERALSRSSQRSSDEFANATTPLTASRPGAPSSDSDNNNDNSNYPYEDDISEFSSNYSNSQPRQQQPNGDDDGYHSEIRSFGDQSQDQGVDSLWNDGGEQEAVQIVYEQAQMGTIRYGNATRTLNQEVTVRHPLERNNNVAAAIWQENPADDVLITQPHRREHDSDDDSQNGGSAGRHTIPPVDFDADTLPYDQASAGSNDSVAISEADTLPYNPNDSLAPNEEEDVPSPLSHQSRGENQYENKFYEDNTQFVFSPSPPMPIRQGTQVSGFSVSGELDGHDLDLAPLPHRREEGMERTETRTPNSLDPFGPEDGVDVFDDLELPSSPQHQTEDGTARKSSTPNSDHDELDDAALIPLQIQPSSPVKPPSHHGKQPSTLKRQSSSEETGSFMDGMFSSLSTCKSSPSFSEDRVSSIPPLKSQQQKSSILDYSRVVKSSLTSSNSPSQEKDEKKSQAAVDKDTEDLKSPKILQLNNSSYSINSPKTPESGKKASQTSNSSHQCTLSEYYAKQKTIDSPPYTPRKEGRRRRQQQQQQQQRKSPFQGSNPLSQQSQKSSASSRPSNNLHQTTLSEYPHYTNKSDLSAVFDADDDNDNNNTKSVSPSPSSSQRCVVRRNPPLGLNRKHAQSVPLTQGSSSSTSTSNTKRRRPTTNLAELCKASQIPRKRTLGLRAPRRRSPH